MRLLICIALLPMMAWAQEDVAQQFVGKPVAEILDTLRSEGTNLAYSTNLVTSDLLVVAEPELGEPDVRLDERLRADDEVDLAGPDRRQCLPPPLRREPPGQQQPPNATVAEGRFKRAPVLLGEHLRRGH